MKMVKLQDLGKDARSFARAKDNSELRLVRSRTQFERFAYEEFDKLRTLRNGDEGAKNKKRIAYWFTELEHGLIGDIDAFDEFVEIEKGAAAPTSKTRGPKKAKAEKTEAPKATKTRGKKSKVEDVGEPDLVLDFDEEYPAEHNLGEFARGIKETMKFHGQRPTIENILSVLQTSQNLKDLLSLALDEVK